VPSGRCSPRNHDKGPQGIGKLHLIVNLVCQLLYHSNGKYFVTFIPNCAIWNSALLLLKFICKLFGSTPEALGIHITGVNKLNEILLKETVAAIDVKLATLGQQWVFISDQIDHLSGCYQNINDISTLPFPFNYMHQIMKLGWIPCMCNLVHQPKSTIRSKSSLLFRMGNHDFLGIRSLLEVFGI